MLPVLRSAGRWMRVAPALSGLATSALCRRIVVRNASYVPRHVIVLRDVRGGRSGGEWFDGGGPGRRPTLRERLGNPFMLSVLAVIGVGGSIYYFTHQEDVPITNRRHFVDVDRSQEMILGERAFRALQRQYKHKLLPASDPVRKWKCFSSVDDVVMRVKAIKHVGMRIVQASGIEDIQKLKWEFAVIDDPLVNAMVLPGGKVVVFTGIIPIMKNLDGLAVVLGHEIGHVVGRHSAERMSFSKILLAVSLALSMFIDSQALINMFTQMVLSLPHSRRTEAEADHIGMVLMARACFNPREAPRFWDRMDGRTNPRTVKGDREHDSHSVDITEFFGTHPSHAHRRQDIEKLMPKVMLEREMHCQHLLDDAAAAQRSGMLA